MPNSIMLMQMAARFREDARQTKLEGYVALMLQAADDLECLARGRELPPFRELKLRTV